MTVKQPLYGHTSRETAYMVASYPYGRLRCRIWFWLERSPKNGYRFCYQTENPKNGRMNAPKKGTYNLIGACMYLDENDHVSYAALSPYSTPQEIMQFVLDFPQAECFRTVSVWAQAKRSYERKCIALGRTPYGPLDETRKREAEQAIDLYTQVLDRIGTAQETNEPIAEIH